MTARSSPALPGSKSRRKPAGSFPSALPARILLFQIFEHGLEVARHRLGAQVRTGGLADQFAPGLHGPLPENALQEVPRRLAAVVIAGVRILLENVAADLVVQLVLQDGGHSVVVILGRVVIDVGLGSRIAE